MEHNCNYEERWGKVLAQLENMSAKICGHINEGDKQGGFRDRIIILEQEVSALKQAEWGRVIAAGVIGGLIGNLSPDLIKGLLWLVGIK